MEPRDLLFGDVPAEAWPSNSGGAPHDVEPWESFVEARNAATAGQRSPAADALRRVLATEGLESRHYLQAWHFLRALGMTPDDAAAHRLYGVVVEAALAEGLDVLAGYADHTARYFNFSGAAVVWERADDSLDASIDALLAAGARVVKATGPWAAARPPAPPAGQVRINMLTPGGLHFGQAAFGVLAADSIGGPVLSAATELMRALIERSENSRAEPR